MRETLAPCMDLLQMINPTGRALDRNISLLGEKNVERHGVKLGERLWVYSKCFTQREADGRNVTFPGEQISNGTERNFGNDCGFPQNS